MLFMCLLSGDTTEQAATSAGSGADLKPVNDIDVKPVDDTDVKAVTSTDVRPVSDVNAVEVDNEIVFVLPPSMAEKIAEEIPVSCSLPPSPPMDTDQISTQVKPDPDTEDTLQAASSDESAGYVSCSSSMITAADEGSEDQQSTADVTPGFFHRASRHLMSAASKYRLRCQCGAKNCRQYLY